MVAVFGWQLFKYRRIVASVPVTSKLLGLKKFDGLVQLSRGFGLFDPVTLRRIFDRPADEVGSNGSRHTTSQAAFRLDVEIFSGHFRSEVIAHFGHATSNQLDLDIRKSW
jgi:hypothetical protein